MKLLDKFRRKDTSWAEHTDAALQVVSDPAKEWTVEDYLEEIQGLARMAEELASAAEFALVTGFFEDAVKYTGRLGRLTHLIKGLTAEALEEGAQKW